MARESCCDDTSEWKQQALTRAALPTSGPFCRDQNYTEMQAFDEKVR